MTLVFALLSGAICLLLRVLRVIRDNTNFLYNYIGTLNICLGLFLLIVSLIDTHSVTRQTIIIMLTNLVIGFFILIDIYLKRQQVV